MNYIIYTNLLSKRKNISVKNIYLLRIDKKRIDKNREDILRDNFRQLAKQWQSNVDADEANKEIRTQ